VAIHRGVAQLVITYIKRRHDTAMTWFLWWDALIYIGVAEFGDPRRWTNGPWRIGNMPAIIRKLYLTAEERHLDAKREQMPRDPEKDQ
jgi:hypothetical protein